MISLYDYLQKAAGVELGTKVYAVAKKQNIKIGKRDIDNPKFKGQVVLYPPEFLESYFAGNK